MPVNAKALQAPALPSREVRLIPNWSASGAEAVEARDADVR
jgi:hypothetical protein